MSFLDKTGLKSILLDIKSRLGTKQNTIDDIDAIRSGAALGVTALQHHQDISSKADTANTLAGYGITDAYTKDEIDTIVGSVYKYKGTVTTVDDLPNDENEVGDVYSVDEDHTSYVWNGTEWSAISAIVDISGKADKGETLKDYGITDAYTKDDIDHFIEYNRPPIVDDKSYLINGKVKFNKYQEVVANFYLLELGDLGYHPVNAMGSGGVYVLNSTDHDLTMVFGIAKHTDSTVSGNYTVGHAAGSASPSDIFYALSGSDVQESQSGTVPVNETLVSIPVPAGRKGFIYSNAWDAASVCPLEIRKVFISENLTTSADFQGIVIKREAMNPRPVVVSQEEYDAINPKDPDAIYYILED